MLLFVMLFSKLCFVPACLHKFTLLTGDFIARPHAENGEIYPCECMNCYILLPAFAASNCGSVINLKRYLLKSYSFVEGDCRKYW